MSKKKWQETGQCWNEGKKAWRRKCWGEETGKVTEQWDRVSSGGKTVRQWEAGGSLALCFKTYLLLRPRYTGAPQFLNARSLRNLSASLSKSKIFSVHSQLSIQLKRGTKTTAHLKGCCSACVGSFLNVKTWTTVASPQWTQFRVRSLPTSFLTLMETTLSPSLGVKATTEGKE